MIYAFAKEFGWTPEITISLPMNQVIMLLNCMTEESDTIKEMHDEEKTDDPQSMEFTPKNKNAKNLSEMDTDQLHRTLKQEFGTSQGGGA